MTTYFGFLRAINTGRRKVAMTELRDALADLGLADVTTFLNSGNVVFSSPRQPARLERDIERCIEGFAGFAVETFVRTAAELRAVLAYRPFDGFEPGHGPKVQVGFVRAELGPATATAVEALRTDVDELRVHGREVHWWTAGSTMDSEVRDVDLARALGGPVTFRNVTSLTKLAAKHLDG